MKERKGFMMLRKKRAGAVALALMIVSLTAAGLSERASDTEQRLMPLFEYLGADTVAWGRKAEDVPPEKLVVYENHCLYGGEPMIFTDPAFIGGVVGLLREIEVVAGSDDQEIATGTDTVFDFYDEAGKTQKFVFQNGRLYRDASTREGTLLEVHGLEALMRFVFPVYRIEELRALMREDKPEDGYGIYWNGISLSRDRDILDEAGILDGRGGPYALEYRTVLDSIELSCPVWPRHVLEDTDTLFEAADRSWYCRAERGSREDIAARYEHSGAFYPLGNINIRDVGERALHLGFINGGGQRYLGYACAIEKDGETVILVLGGIGNLSDIRVMAGFLFGGSLLVE